jgi:hypothetical protein
MLRSRATAMHIEFGVLALSMVPVRRGVKWQERHG